MVVATPNWYSDAVMAWPLLSGGRLSDCTYAVVLAPAGRTSEFFHGCLAGPWLVIAWGKPARARTDSAMVSATTQAGVWRWRCARAPGTARFWWYAVSVTAPPCVLAPADLAYDTNSKMPELMHGNFHVCRPGCIHHVSAARQCAWRHARRTHHLVPGRLRRKEEAKRADDGARLARRGADAVARGLPLGREQLSRASQRNAAASATRVCTVVAQRQRRTHMTNVVALGPQLAKKKQSA